MASIKRDHFIVADSICVATVFVVLAKLCLCYSREYLIRENVQLLWKIHSYS